MYGFNLPEALVGGGMGGGGGALAAVAGGGGGCGATGGSANKRHNIDILSWNTSSIRGPHWV